MIRKILASIVFCAISTLLQAQTSHAAVTGFNPGRIIDDAVFTNTSTMSPQDIQSFLNSKVPVCDTWGTQPYAGTTRASYAASRGYSTPFTCLKDYTENGKSSAQIIYDVAQQYRINPQVLIVLLQKEQGLVTDSWPYASQYQKATGYGCPDTAPCNTAYYGFTNQLTKASNMFRMILDNSPYWYTPYVLGNNYIQYNPSTSCGGSTVYIQNRSTQALYNYTPYQPNQATLDAEWGTAPCGAYGNRNFYLYFTSWFGATTHPYFAANISQTPAVTIAPGDQGSSVSFKFKNSGSHTWYDDISAAPGVPRVHLATSSPVNRTSVFSAGWPNHARPAVNFSAVYEADGVTLASSQHIVQPGQIGQFTVNLNAPFTLAEGVYPEVFQPVADGSSQWGMGVAVQTNVNIVNKYKAASTWQSATKQTGFQNDIVSQPTVLRFKNIGLSQWHDDTSAPVNTPRVHLATDNPVNRSSRFGANWPHPARPAVNFSSVYEADGITLAANQHIVSPGQIGEFTFQFTIPDNLGWGNYTEKFRVVADGSSQWDTSGQTEVNVWVNAVNHVASYYSQSPYPVVSPGQTGNGYLQYRNAGNSVWYDDVSAPKGVFPVHLATNAPVNRSSVSAAPSWSNAARPAVNFSKVFESDGATLSSNQHIVKPGQIAHYDITFLNATLPLGSLSREHLNPVLEGSSRWSMTSQGVWLDVLSR